MLIDGFNFLLFNAAMLKSLPGTGCGAISLNN
jgi:hypothetical protein